MINQQKSPTINYKSLKIFKTLTKGLKDNQESNNNQGPNQIIHSLTSKTRFFKLFIENKKLIKQGLYLLEICQNAAGSTNLAMGRRGHDGLSWTPSSHTCAISLLISLLPSTEGMTYRHRHNGPSRVSVPKHLNSWNLGTRNTSLIFMTNQ